VTHLLTEAPWLLELAARQPFGPADRLGTANYLDSTARRRAVAATRSGQVVSLARPLVDGPTARGDSRPALSVELFVTDMGAITMASDHVELDCHGRNHTHLDALNHVGLGGTWYGNRPVHDPDPPSIVDLAGAGLIARGVLVDIPAVRGTPWVEPGRPVTAEDIDSALAGAGVTFEPGDALLVYMGRDRFEAAGHTYLEGRPGSPSPGLGEDGARWVADHRTSILCWDFLDEYPRQRGQSNAHSLVWAIGQLLVDNCDFAALKAAGADTGVAGTLVLAPLALPGGTGCVVNPLVLR
jgi:kynurenine formamidase